MENTRMMLQTEVLLAKLKENDVGSVKSSLLWVNSVTENRHLLDNMAKFIINHALSPVSDYCLKYLQLAKELEDFTVNNPKEETKFKDIFIKKSVEIFKDLQKNKYPDVGTREKVAFFMGNLFNVGIITSALMAHWLTATKSQVDVYGKMLKTIEDKVKLESERPVRDASINALMAKMLLNNQTNQR